MVGTSRSFRNTKPPSPKGGLRTGRGLRTLKGVKITQANEISMKENMFYGASHLIFKRAEELRNRMTSAEEILWKHIHINEWKLKFRRQHPIWNYVVDFYCHGIKLVIELDGGIHDAEDVKNMIRKGKDI